MIDQSNVNFYIAEVVGYSNTFKQNSENVNKLCAIDVLVKINSNTKIISNVIPSDNNIKKIPVIGEVILIYQGYNQNSSFFKREHQWYYLHTIGIQSAINNNISPINSQTFTPDPEFTDFSVSPLQPYVGDLIIEGRFGNTIRLGSTPSNQNRYDQPTTWLGTNNTDPIIIISNGQVNQKEKFTVENIEQDNASLYLTSTQTLPNFKLNNTIRKGKKSESDFSNSQFIGVADRITLKSKQDVIVLDSEFAIELNAPTLSIGLKKEKEPGLHSTAVIKLFKLFIQLMNGGLLDSSGVPVIADPTILSQIRSELKRTKNKNINQDTF